MGLARRSEDEQERLAELRSFRILDTGREPAFDEVVELLAAQLDMPVALISLVDEDRQWFKAAHGLELDGSPLEQSICAHAILQDGVLEIEDTLLDLRSADNPLCCGLSGTMRYYAGAPLVTRSGHRIGTLCVLDHHPRKLAPLQRRLLEVMAGQVMRQLDLQRALANKEVLREEIDHRVKNSLQTVASTIRLYRGRSGNDETREALDAIARRVDSVSQLHAALNQTSKMHFVRIDTYLGRVATLLQRHAPEGVVLHVEAPDLEVESRVAASIGVMASEFAANAGKYAFRGQYAGAEVRFTLERHGPNALVFTCRDNGPGPEPGSRLDVLASSALGARLLEAAAQQVGGLLTQGREPGGFVLRAELPVDPAEEVPFTSESGFAAAPAAE
ncbi:sensor histidine kinase [Salipiger marinus]|uniref:Two-component sensor histidine kinase, contains HisKA and HATPase domains n=1 Tax=Salipiger marinus TaxID=555512 RepID=A0A1G8TMM6_9RHOB|nr:histidine kinase dimerization/phosphoacceptor domain -containing protein [Salipiger marinus]SDJ42836.1 Two-component sensor histidine kinase, contains HisKA and HATPase domains [Salipiger marinus]